MQFDPFDIKADMKTKLTDDIIDCLLSELNKDSFNNKAIATLSDILLIILVKWQETAIESEEEFNKKIVLLLKRCEKTKEKPFVPLSQHNRVFGHPILKACHRRLQFL